MATFQRLVRFLAKDGRIYHGDAILAKGTTDIGKASQARLIKGSPTGPHSVTNETADIKLLLSPLAREQTGTLRCLGLNYEKHAHETNMPIPKYPILFYKPITSISGPFDPIRIPKMAQEVEGLDYECELVIVIGKGGANISEHNALDHVLGYCIGNDVSHREWQLKRGGGQWALGKGFDTWAPYGPGIVSSSIIKDPDSLKIQTKLNGKIVQESNTKDLIFGVKETVAFLSRGTTLLTGDLIFTGTPEGVGAGRKPPLWLQDGDVVEVTLEGVGTCKNKIEFVKDDDRSKL